MLSKYLLLVLPISAAIVNIIIIAIEWNPLIKFSSWSGIYHLKHVIGLAYSFLIIKLY